MKLTALGGCFSLISFIKQSFVEM